MGIGKFLMIFFVNIYTTILLLKEDNRLFLRTIMYWEYDEDTQLKV